MTKNDYIVIANRIKLATYVDHPNDIDKRGLISSLSAFFKVENPNFNFTKFSKACYFEDK